jgi:hypothetical protein
MIGYLDYGPADACTRPWHLAIGCEGVTRPLHEQHPDLADQIAASRAYNQAMGRPD